MWFVKPSSYPDWSHALRHLRRSDPVLAPIIRRVGPCTLAPRRDHFATLVRSIYTQQISTKIATVMYGRFCEQFPRKRPTPGRVLTFLNGDADEQTIRRCGLSRQKRAYVIDLSSHFIDGRIPTRRFARMSDEQVIESLTRVNGVGRWTAELFLIFVLNRPDVWPAADLGLQESYRIHFGLKARPTRRQLDALGERFRPYRTIAAWYLWRALAGS
jgi:DNA-3-methyladenine glycosylase II